jgi:hypothetical protein
LRNVDVFHNSKIRQRSTKYQQDEYQQNDRRQFDKMQTKHLANRVVSILELRRLSDKLNISELFDVCKCAKYVFAKEPVEIRIDATIVMFGDLHGQYVDLIC